MLEPFFSNWRWSWSQSPSHTVFFKLEPEHGLLFNREPELGFFFKLEQEPFFSSWSWSQSYFFKLEPGFFFFEKAQLEPKPDLALHPALRVV